MHRYRKSRKKPSVAVKVSYPWILAISKLARRCFRKTAFILLRANFSTVQYTKNRKDLIDLNFTKNDLISHAMSYGYKDNTSYFYKDPVTFLAYLFLRMKVNIFQKVKSEILQKIKTKNGNNLMFHIWNWYRHVFWTIRKIVIYLLLLLSFSKRDYSVGRIDLQSLNRLKLLKHSVEFGYLENFPYFQKNKIRRLQRIILLSNEITLVRFLMRNKKVSKVVYSLNSKYSFQDRIRQWSSDLVPETDLSKFNSIFVVNKLISSATTRPCEECHSDLGKSLHPNLISVIIPVFKTDPKFLVEALQSLSRQSCIAFETIIILDGPQPSSLGLIVSDFQNSMKNVRVIELSENSGISVATNSGIEVAENEYVLFLDHDDMLTPNAISEVSRAIMDLPETDLVYSDHDKVNENGQTFAPEFKPDFSPVLAFSYMYIGHLKVYKKKLFFEFGFFDKNFDGCQDYEWFLRNILEIKNVIHISKVLYHYRVWSGSTTQNPNQNRETLTKTRMAIQDQLARFGFNGDVTQAKFAPDIGICEISWKQRSSRVTIVIPTISLLLVKNCIDSLFHQDFPSNAEILVVDNTDDGHIKKYFSEDIVGLKVRCEWISKRDLGVSEGWSFSKLINRAVNLVKTEYVLLLNDDVRPISKDWLTQMMGYIQFPSVGIVGAKLQFPNGTVQHNGIRLGNFNGLASPIFRGMPSTTNGYLDWNLITREVDAVTAACMLISLDLWNLLGGLDQEDLNVAYNDVDLCLRALDEGFTSVVCTSALLEHLEGATRAKVDNPAEEVFFREKYRDRKSTFTSKNFILDNQNWLIPKVKAGDDAEKTIFDHAKLRIGIWSHNLNLEGASKSLELLTEHLIDMGYQLDVFSGKDGPLKEKYEKLGISPRVFSNIGSYNQTEFLNQIMNLSDVIRFAQLDALLINTSLGFEWALAAKYAGVPTIWMIRESESPKEQFKYAPEWYLNLWEKMLDYVDKVVFVSYSSLDQFRNRLNQGNFAVIQNGYDEQFSEEVRLIPSLKDKLNFISVGTISQRKNQLDSLKAFIEAFSNAKDSATITFVGNVDSEYGQMFKKIVLSHTENGYDIRVVGSTSKIGDFYNEADILLTTSLSESFPRIFLEGLSHSLICIGYPVNGLAEQMRHGWDSFCVEIGNISEMANYMKLLSTNQKLRIQMQQNARFSLQTFDTSKANAQKVEELINELMEQR
jgi:GT2 family glycosyltransferase/glycosyltransferase involved in cell wall biosynthesis